MKHLVFIAFAGCAPDVPEDPSFQQDVLPILAANCVRCHGFPPLGGAPEAFRLDTFEDTVVTDGQPGSGECGGDPDDPSAEVVICGASRYAPVIAPRIRSATRPMPPRFSLDDWQIETIARWASTADRGAPRIDNQPPSLTIESLTQIGTTVTVRARIDDADRDLVVGTVRALVDSRARVVGPVRSGVVELVWNATGVAPGEYPLVATLDDGAQLHELDLGTITITSVP